MAKSSTHPACPICSRPVLPPEVDKNAGKGAYPFCSARCRTIDLGRWVSEAYRIPGESVEHEDLKEEPES